MGLALSCSQPTAGGSTSNANTTGVATGVAIDNLGNVYVTGWSGTSSSASPCYWKNGTLVGSLSLSGYTYFVVTQAFEDTTHNNLYIMGSVGTSSSSLMPCYWENGTLYTLDYAGNIWGQASGAVVDSSGNLYITGYLGSSSSSYVPYFWKNNSNATILPLNSKAYGWANGIAIYSSTIYIAGTEGNSSSDEVPCFWTVIGTSAATAIDLPMNTGNTFGVARGVVVSGSSAYISGAEGTASTSKVPCYWTVNGTSPGTASDLPIGANTYGWAQGIAINGSNVYIAGIEGTSSSTDPCYWENGSPVSTMPVGTGNSSYWEYWASADTSGNLYTVGAVGTSSSTPIPCYWENGTLHLLDMGVHASMSAQMRGVAVTPLAGTQGLSGDGGGM